MKTDPPNKPFPFYLIGALTGIVLAFFVYILRLFRNLPSNPEPTQDGSLEPVPGREITDPVNQEAGSIYSGVSFVKGQGQTTSSSRLAGQTAGSIPEGALSGRRSRSPRWSLTTKYLVGTGLVIFLVILLYAIRSVYPIFIIALLITFLLRPVISFLTHKLKWRRGLSILVTYILFIIFLILLPLLLLPSTINAVNFVLTIDFAEIITQVAASLEDIVTRIDSIPLINIWLTPLLKNGSSFIANLTTASPPTGEEVVVNFADITQQLGETLGVIVKIVGPIVSIFITIFFILMLSIYFSISGPRFQKWYPTIIPPAYREDISALIEKIDRIWVSFLEGQLVLMFVIGFMVWMGNTILGTPQAFLLGIIAGLLEVVPNLGPFLATIPAIILALLFGSSYIPINHLIFALIVLVMYIIIQQLENNYIVPKLLGDAVNLPPVIVLLGVVIFGSMFGILGILVASPIIATGKEIIGYLYLKILEPPQPTIIVPENPGVFKKIQNFFKKIPASLARKSSEPAKHTDSE